VAALQKGSGGVSGWIMALSHMRPYEIREVRRDAGFTLRDLWNDAELTVAARAATHSLVAGETLFARVNAGPDGELEFNGALLPLMLAVMHERGSRASRGGFPGHDERWRRGATLKDPTASAAT